MKVCFVCFELSQYHGYGRVALNLVRGLKRLGVTGPILTHSGSPKPRDLATRTFPLLTHEPTTPLSRPLRLYRDWQLIKRFSPSCQGIHFLTESNLATTLFGYHKPYVVTIYGTWAVNPLKANPLTKEVFLRGFNQAQAIVSISQYTKKRLEEAGRYLKPRIEVIYPGISSNRNLPKNQGRNSNLILSVGALGPTKGFLVSVAAVAQHARKSGLPIRYVIVSGREEPRFAAKLQDIARRYQFRGLEIQYQISDRELKKLYQKAGIFLLTPIEIDEDFEGFGLIYLEAFAAGLPVIASRSGAIPETVENEETGLLVEEGDVKATVKALDRMLTDTKLRQRCVRNGLKKVKSYSVETMANHYYKIYKQIFSS